MTYRGGDDMKRVITLFAILSVLALLGTVLWLGVFSVDSIAETTVEQEIYREAQVELMRECWEDANITKWASHESRAILAAAFFEYRTRGR
jgi:hypothetical protein